MAARSPLSLCSMVEEEAKLEEMMRARIECLKKDLEGMMADSASFRSSPNESRRMANILNSQASYGLCLRWAPSMPPESTWRRLGIY